MTENEALAIEFAIDEWFDMLVASNLLSAGTGTLGPYVTDELLERAAERAVALRVKTRAARDRAGE